MKNLQCNKSAGTYVQQLGNDATVFLKDELDGNKIENILNEIINNININILTKKYDSFQDALQEVPHQSRQLITLIQMYNVYITECNDSVYTTLLRKNMCKNKKIICRSYHLLHLWSLLVLDCLIFTKTITAIDYTSLVNENIHINASDACIKKITSIATSKLNLAKQLIGCALHLRQNFKKYCNVSIDFNHKMFIGSLKKTIKQIDKINPV
jgi:5'(3')-deoxyribonucleotidase